jgi:hypothetical protein
MQIRVKDDKEDVELRAKALSLVTRRLSFSISTLHLAEAQHPATHTHNSWSWDMTTLSAPYQAVHILPYREYLRTFL